MKVAFYVSGKAGRLMYYINQHSFVLQDICLVVSDEPNNELENKLFDLGLNYFHFEYDKNANRKKENLRLSNFLLEKLEMFDIDYCYSHGGHILSGDLLRKYENRLINFHPSILPMHPGLNAIDKAMKDNSSILIGNSAHFINEKVDDGMLIAQNVFPKSYFLVNGYEVFLNTQINLLELIHKNLNTGGLKLLNGMVYLKLYSKKDLNRVYFNHE